MAPLPSTQHLAGAVEIGRPTDDVANALDDMDETQQEELPQTVLEDLVVSITDGMTMRAIRYSKQSQGYGKAIEICTSEMPTLGIVANEYPNTSVHRVAKGKVFSSKRTIGVLRR